MNLINMNQYETKRDKNKIVKSNQFSLSLWNNKQINIYDKTENIDTSSFENQQKLWLKEMDFENWKNRPLATKLTRTVLYAFILQNADPEFSV